MATDLVELVDRVASGTIECGYDNEWDWGEGVALHGILAAGLALKSQRYVDYVHAWLERHRDHHPSLIRHVMPGLPAVLAYKHWGDENGLALSHRIGSMLQRSPRSVHGCFQESPQRPVWVDYWYEIAPFLCVLAEVTGEEHWYDLAAEQSIANAHACWDPSSGLFWHMFYDSIAANSSFRWARANGWCVLAIVDMLALLPGHGGLKSHLHRLLERQADALARMQHPGGLWHTVLDHPETYLEVSTSVMFSLGLRRAVHAGVLPGTYLSVADRAWDACLSHVDSRGRVTGVSGETPPGDAEHYNTIPRGVYPWGQGFFLLAAVDRLRNRPT